VAGKVGVLHGSRSLVLQDENGQIVGTHSVSAGLDYPSVGPEHSYLHSIGRARYVAADDQTALAGFRELCRWRGSSRPSSRPT
jgi:tryptophan synthase beta chain